MRLLLFATVISAERVSALAQTQSLFKQGYEKACRARLEPKAVQQVALQKIASNKGSSKARLADSEKPCPYAKTFLGTSSFF